MSWAARLLCIGHGVYLKKFEKSLLDRLGEGHLPTCPRSLLRLVVFVARNQPLALFRGVARAAAFKLRRRGRRYAYVAWADHGFFANFRAVVHSIHDVESRGRRPVAVSSRYAFERYGGIVHCGRNLYWSKDGHRGSGNTWEYYFEPLSGVSADVELVAVRNIKRSLDHPRFLVKEQKFVEEHRDNGYVNAHWARVHGLRDYPTPEYRRLMNEIISRHVRVKPCIRGKVERFHAARMARRKVLGVHVRKGDHEGNEVVPTRLEDFAAIIDGQPQFERIYLATDCRDTAEYFRKRYGDRLLTRDVRRTSGKEGIHTAAETVGCRPELGEEVLIDALLLARCGMFVHGNSNMNFAVLCWNPDMPHVNVYAFRMAGQTR